MKAMLSNLQLQRAPALCLALAALFLGARPARAEILLTNVQAVNVTPSGFSLIGAVSPPLASTTNLAVSVFGDPGGATNLAGQVGVQFYPLNSGSPAATNSYQVLLSQAALQQDSIALGLIYARVSYCAPGTTYYYRVAVAGPNGQSAVWPRTGPLPSVTTAQANSFVLDSQQLVITLNDANPAGSILTLSNTNTVSVLAAVVGDGAATNQAFFNVNDLLAASGSTNFAPNGSQVFTATLLGLTSPGPAAPGLSQTYDLIFTNGFAVSAPSLGSIGLLSTFVSAGSAAVLAGGSGSVPITVTSQSALASLAFTISLPTNLFTSLSVQVTSPLLQSASLQALSSNQVQLSFVAAGGANMLGSRQVAQLDFATAANDDSAFVSLWPQSLQGSNTDGSTPAAFDGIPGRVVIVGPQPLLDTQFQGISRNLVLYGIPNDSYQIQYSTNLAAGNGGWANLLRVPLTSLWEVISNIEPAPPQIFFRASQFTASQAIVDAGYSGGNEVLTLYAPPGLAYEFEYATSLLGPWKVLAYVPMTNSFALVTGLSETNTDVYYLYKPLNADPPLLQASLTGAGRSLAAYGISGTNYTLQFTTNLSPTVAWHPLLSYTLTNSFRFFTNLAATNPSIFYRIQKP